MKFRRYFFLLLIIIISQPAFTQRIQVKAANEALSSVVRRLKVEVSFDNKVLSVYRVTMNKFFSSPDAAIKYLIKGKPLQLTRVAGVYVITTKMTKEKKMEPKVVYKYVVKKEQDPHPMDLTMSLKEIVITAANHTPSLWGEDENAQSRFTAVTANVMPGSSDNSVFNVLRMMPGIRASGEPSDELYVWGSSPGESRVTLDGIPLFAMQSYNSNISYINPYMSAEVRYKRGILSAGEGSQTGAKVDVISGTSQFTRPVFKAMVSTMSANVFGAVPIGEKCMASVAYRHTLQGLFGGSTFDAYRKRTNGSSEKERSTTQLQTNDESGNETNTSENSGNETSESTTSITPKYDFQDVNLNLAGTMGQTTKFKLSLYGARDYLNYNFNDTLNSQIDQTSYQGGISAHVNQMWHNGTSSDFSTFFSGLYSKQNGLLALGTEHVDSTATENVSEFNVRYQQNGIGKIKGLSFGGELTAYHVRNAVVDYKTTQPTLFVDEKYKWRGLNVEVGLRTDFMSDGVNWQPRALVKYTFLHDFTVTTSWGIYNQYIVKDPFSSAGNSYQFNWDINTSLKTYNTVAGIAYNHGGLNLSVEGYLKEIRHSVWVIDNTIGKYDFNLKGIDVSAKYNWRRGLFFASWSLSDDPRQGAGVANELKAGGIFRFYPFTVSANYVFGHGYNSMLLPESSYNEHSKNISDLSTSTTYSRMDIYASYEKQFKHFGITIGGSLINVFDTDNQKYVTSWMLHGRSSSYTNKASRFTPIVFLEIRY
jgi:hypothetical protein